MRKELMEYLHSLSNIDYQRRVWVNGLPHIGVEHDEFSYAVHFLFDDTDLSRDAESTIGDILLDREEAKLVGAVTGAIEKIFDKYGTDLTDAQYLSLPEWQDVISTATDAAFCISGPELEI